jgi:hypothetical protein
MAAILTNAVTLALALVLAILLLALAPWLLRGIGYVLAELLPVALYAALVVGLVFLALAAVYALMTAPFMPSWPPREWSPFPTTLTPEVGLALMLALMGAFFGLVWLAWWVWQQIQRRRVR